MVTIWGIKVITFRELAEELDKFEKEYYDCEGTNSSIIPFICSKFPELKEEFRKLSYIEERLVEGKRRWKESAKIAVEN